MSVKQIQQNKKEILIHDFEKGLDHALKAIERELTLEYSVFFVKFYSRLI